MRACVQDNYTLINEMSAQLTHTNRHSVRVQPHFNWFHEIETSVLFEQIFYNYKNNDNLGLNCEIFLEFL